MKGLLTKQDPNHAFDVIKRNHMPGGMLGKKEDVEFYIKKGWWPENAGIGIEAAFQDWGISQMAYKLNKFDDYKYFKKRSRNWEPNFSSEIQLLLPKDRNGRFIHKDPLSNVGWVESNSWQATWGVSHDIYRLIELMGGEENFCKKLNYAFSQSEKDDFVYSYSNGYISYANQPGCSDAHVFSYARKPWLTQYWVRKVKQQAYGGTTPDLGYGGHDEDQGQMSAIDVLMSIGLFNILGTESIKPFYEITSPIFDEIIIKLDNNYYQGDRFIIKTHNNNRDNVYINKASFNGNVLNRFWITHDDFQKGGIMELWLDKVPNYNWGTNELPKIQ
jgi:predicted alpha-1,2-mannosidase